MPTVALGKRRRAAADTEIFAPWRLEKLALLASLVLVVFYNNRFWQALITPERLAQASGWRFLFAVACILLATHFILLALLLNRWTVRWLPAVLLSASALATYYMARYQIYIDPSMLRNVFATDVGEASDLLTWSLLPHLLLYAALPAWAWQRLWRRRSGASGVLTPASTPLRALLRRSLAIFLAALLGAIALWSVYQEMAATMRNDKGLRYLITPANLVYAIGRVSVGQARAAQIKREAIGLDAQPGTRLAAQKKPLLLVMVLGETARAANWGLSGYARQTTPELAAAGVINFAQVSSCGSNTEASVPCLFSPWGRRQYDEDRIRNSESLLDVAARAGFRVVWVDNQSGCKGVCSGVESTRPESATANLASKACASGQCLDGAMLASLEQSIASTPGNLLVVLHQMGNHGPAYYKRYPPEFSIYEPACKEADLARCSPASIVNAYDNALRYTDHVLAATLALLKATPEHQTAMLYVSDHGESLGENGLYLHGIPYAFAPREQTEVPMVMWLSPAYQRSFAVDSNCLARRASAPATHDHLFHTLLGLLDINTALYEPEWDLTRGCRA